MSEQVSGKQEQALIALLTEATIEGAAAKAGVNARTLFRWLNHPPFVAAYRDARRQAVQHATSRLQHAASDAVTTLREVMMDAEAPAPARVNAAKSVLELAIKAVEIEDLTARIETLESRHPSPQEKP